MHDRLNGIKDVFNDECAHLEIGPKLVAKIQKYNQDFVNKNSDSIEFFGGNLTGVHVVRFTNGDRDRWFDEILEVSDGPLEERLLALPDVNAEFHVSSDTMNISCVWLLHALFTSPHLTEEQKHIAMIDVALVLQYKYLTSLLFRYFRYPADKSTAEATYAQLSLKYAIKIYGSWAALLRARSEEIISNTSIHYKTIMNFSVDTEITYMLNDTQGRIRDILKNIYAVFDRVHHQGTRISTTSSVSVEHDGVEILKDKTKNTLAYGRYIKSIIGDKDSFIRTELTSVIENMIHTMPPRLFHESLEWMSNNYMQSGAGIIEEVINETIVHSFDYLSHNRDIVKNDNDIGGLLGKLKGVYMSSRSTDETLYSLREKVEKIVKAATGSKNESVISSVRTGVLLYINIRCYTMRHYTSGV